MTPLTPLPGALAPPESIQQQLTAALEEELARHADLHTRNIGPDGKPLFTNRLILSTSPYLHQHAHNPVDWRPWGAEAFEEAKRLNRPIFLSVGYSTCHWCHVMARESFEDVETARVMNERYINIKVDREERPDVDSLYMTSVQLFTGQGGWPMSVWLTPDGKPYYGGTYFPPSDRYGRPGFADIMTQLADYYARQPAEAAGRGEQVVERIRHFSTVEKDGLSPAPELLKDALAVLARNFDSEWGGFGHAPKFPKAMEVDFLLRCHRRTGDAKLLAMATTTLDRMAEGGMYDQVGGGFHRYSVDGEWLVPHFEKMLYDNALLASAYTDAFQATGRKAYVRIARETLDYLLREMQDQRGGFYSATDADSEGEEGKFFVWPLAEVKSLLGKDAPAFIAFYQMSEGGNFEGHNIPRLARGSLADSVPPGIEAARKTLYDEREKRIHPHLDDKVLASWNGLTISALAKAGFVLDEPRYLQAAERAADFVLGTMTRNGRLLRSARDGKADHPAFLTDYANMIAGLLDLFESTQQRRWLAEARRLQVLQDKHFHDGESGCYFFTASDHETLIAREIPIYDNARPSGNSVTLHNLWRLAEYAGDDTLKDRALACVGSLLPKMGGGHSPVFLSAIERILDKSKEIVIVGDAPAPMIGLMRATYLPNRALMVLKPSEAADGDVVKDLPLAANKTAQEGRTTAYVCMDKVCLEPTTELAAFARQLSQAEPLEPGKPPSGVENP